MPLTCVIKCFAVKKKQGKAAYGVSPTLLPFHSERLGAEALRLAERESTPFFSQIEAGYESKLASLPPLGQGLLRCEGTNSIHRRLGHARRRGRCRWPSAGGIAHNLAGRRLR